MDSGDQDLCPADYDMLFGYLSEDMDAMDPNVLEKRKHNGTGKLPFYKYSERDQIALFGEVSTSSAKECAALCNKVGALCKSFRWSKTLQWCKITVIIITLFYVLRSNYV